MIPTVIDGIGNAFLGRYWLWLFVIRRGEELLS